MARIVLLAQRSELFDFVEHALIGEGHRVRSLHQVEISIATIRHLLPDLIIVDAETSTSPTKKLRVRKRGTRTLDNLRILVVRSASRKAGDGASEREGVAFLDRPLDPESLIDRVRVMLDSKDLSDPKRHIVIANLKIDPFTWRVTRSDKLLPLSTKEFRLLYYLASHPGVTFHRHHLANVGWPNLQVAPETVDVFMRNIRKKIEEDPKQPRIIVTERAQGYRLQIPQERSGRAT